MISTKCNRPPFVGARIRTALTLRMAGVFFAGALVAGFARADTVTDWNAIMQTTVTTAPTNPIFQTR